MNESQISGDIITGNSGDEIQHYQLDRIVQTREQLGDDLLRKVGTLFELGPEDNIYEFVAVALNRCLGDAIVVANSYDQTANTLRVRAITGIGANIDRIIALLGIHPLHLEVPMNQAAREGLASGRLEKVPGGIYELADHAIPQTICNGIEDVLHISSCYGMGITWLDRIMGSVAILARSELTDTRVIQTFISRSAVAIHRRLDYQANEL